jgi:4-azaleucine resistance transporter AzlC
MMKGFHLSRDFTSALKTAFPLTLPVLTGYLVLGAAYGMLMDSIGYGWGWTFLASLTTYAGSMQFVAVSLLAAGFNPFNTALMTLMVNARHIFYSLSMLSRFEGTGKIKPYLIFGLTDETFSVLSANQAPEGINSKQFVLSVTLLNHIYWVSGSVLGNLIGSLLPISTKGLEFALTALFVVIFLDQWRTVAHRIPALIGIAGSLLALWLFGPGHFIIPALFIILIAITAARRWLDPKERVL